MWDRIAATAASPSRAWIAQTFASCSSCAPRPPWSAKTAGAPEGNGPARGCAKANPHFSWLSFDPRRLMPPRWTGRASRRDWQSMQSFTPGTARRRASGIGSSHSAQWARLSPEGRVLACIRLISSSIEASICSFTAPSRVHPPAMRSILRDPPAPPCRPRSVLANVSDALSRPIALPRPAGTREL